MTPRRRRPVSSSSGVMQRRSWAPHRLANALAAVALLTLPLAPMSTLRAQNLPAGLNVAHGQAQVGLQGNQMTVTNSNNAILNWNSFNIGASHAVRFQQPDAASQVLNRVVGNDPSQILGQLSSNGRVWLLNPNGVLFGANARVDVGSLVVSTLRLNDADWLGGRISMGALAADGDASIVNQGQLRSSLGGRVALVAANVRNEGSVDAPAGQVVLAAGRSVDLIDTATPNIRVRVNVPAGEVLNLGALSAAGGRVDVHAAALNHKGSISTDGASGGHVTLDAGAGRLMVEGSVTAQGEADQAGSGAGGNIHLFGAEVGVVGAGLLDASGARGGGVILVGGGQEGKDTRYTNSRALFFGPTAQARADATQKGQGGRIILWSNESTRAFGEFSARGGPRGGDGGFVETSGGWLDAQPAKIDVGAQNGRVGVWLLDPLNITISDAGIDNLSPSGQATVTFFPSASPAGIRTGRIAEALNNGTNVIVTTAGVGAEAGDISLTGTINVTGTSPGTLLINADQSIEGDGAKITSINPLSVSLSANRTGENAGRVSLVNTEIITGGGAVSIEALSQTSVGGIKIQGSRISARTINLQGGAPDGRSVGVDIDNSSVDATSQLTISGAGSEFGVWIRNRSTVSAVAASTDSAGFLRITGQGLGSATGLAIETSEVERVPTRAGLRAQNIAEVALVGFTDQAEAKAVLIKGSSFEGDANNILMGYIDLISVPRFVIEGIRGAVQLESTELRQARPSSDFIIRASKFEQIESSVLANGKIQIRSDSQIFRGAATEISASDQAGTRVEIRGSDVGNIPGAVKRFDNQVGPSIFGPLTGLNWDIYAQDASVSAVLSVDGKQFNAGGLVPDRKEYGVSDIVSDGELRSFFFQVRPPLLLRGSADSRTYDSTTTASGNGIGAIGILGDIGTLRPGVRLQFVDKNVGEGKSVGFNVPDSQVFDFKDVQGIPIFGYILPPARYIANITPAPLAISGFAFSNKIYDGTTSVSVSGAASLAAPFSGDDVRLFSLTPADYNFKFNTKDAGFNKFIDYSFSYGGIDAGNYSLFVVNARADITRSPLLISGLTANNRVYDATRSVALAGTASFAPIPGDTVVIAGAPFGLFDDKNVGTNKPISLTGLTLSGSDAGNYFPIAQNTLRADITPAPLLVSGLTANNKVYDTTRAASLSGVASVSPFADDVVAVSGSPSATFADKNVGTNKPVTLLGLSLTGSDGGNYQPVLPDSLRADITRAPLLVTGPITANNKVYDTTRVATVTGAATVQPLNGDVVTLSGSLTGEFDNKNAGTNKVVSLSGSSLGGTDGPNYELVYPNTLRADITAAPLIISGLSANDKVYDTTRIATLTGSATFTPLAGDLVSISGSPSGLFEDKNAGTNKLVTLSGLTLAGQDRLNYTPVAPASLRADIEPALLTPAGLSAPNKVYDGQTASVVLGTPRFTPLAGDEIGFSGTPTGQFLNKNAGTNKPITVTGLEINGRDGANYRVQGVGILSANITPATLSISGLTASSKVYDTTRTATLSGTASFTPLAGDVVSVGGNPVALFDDKNVGTNKPVTLSGLTLSGGDAGNYLPVFQGALRADITPATLNVLGLSGANKQYDGNTRIALAGTASVLALPGDQVALVGVEANFDNKNVGTNKPITVSNAQLSGPDAGNYTLGGVNGLTGNVTPAPLAVTGTTVTSRDYDATTAARLANAGTVAPLVGDQVQLNAASAQAQFADKNVGQNKPVTVTGLSLSGQDGPNYVLLPPTGLTANIAPLTLPVTGLSGGNKVYDGTTAATLQGTPRLALLGTDTVTVTTGTASFVDKNAGDSKPILAPTVQLSGADAANYRAAPIAGLIGNVARAPLQVNGVAIADKVYDATVAATITGAPRVTPLAQDQVQLSGQVVAQFADKNVGQGKAVTVSGLSLLGADGGNYSLVLPSNVTASISPLQVTVTGLAGGSKVYDQSRDVALVGSPQVSPLPGDALTVVGGTGQLSSRNVGTWPVTVTGLELGGADRGNYVLAVNPGITGTVTARPLPVSGLAGVNRVYDGTRNAQLSGQPLVQPLPGDGVALAGTLTGQFADKNVGVDRAISTSGLSLTGADAGNYNLVYPVPSAVTATVTPAPLAVAGLAAVNKVYDGSAAASTTGNATVAALAGDAVGVTGTPLARFTGPAAENAGSGKAVAVSGLSLSGADARNYALQPLTLRADIAQAPALYVAVPATRLAGQAVGELSGSVTGLVGTDTLSTATTGVLRFEVPDLAALGTGALGTGTYAINGAGLSSVNYRLSQAPANATALQVVGLSPTASAASGSNNTVPRAEPASTVAVALAAKVAPQAPPSGLVDLTTAQTPTAAAPAAPSTDFGAVRLASLSAAGVRELLDSRERYKQQVFADSVARLQRDPSAADLVPCKNPEQARQGTCLVADEEQRVALAQANLAAAAPVDVNLAGSANSQLVIESPAAGVPPPINTARLPAAAATVASALAQSSNARINRLPVWGNQRGVVESALPQISRKVALVIGVDEYTDKAIPKLDSAIQDAQAIAALLETQLGYETILLRNATKSDVALALNQLISTLRPEDSAVIYYAGHGYEADIEGKGTKQGFWQLADSEASNPQTWLSNASISQALNTMRASQIVLISDSCFSGTLVSGEMQARSKRQIEPNSLLALKTVVAMSSGGNAPVADSGQGGHSPFAFNLISNLKQLSNWQAGANIFEEVKFEVARAMGTHQVPRYGPARSAGHQAGGEYLFEQRRLQKRPE